MHCRKVRTLYTAFSGGELDKKIEKEVTEHLKKCENCRRLFAVVDKISSFAGTYEEVKPNSSLFADILKGIEPIPAKESSLKLKWAFIYTFLFLFIAGFSFGLIRKAIKNKQQMIAKKQEEKVIKREDRYIMDYGKFEKGQVIYSVPGRENSVQVIEVSY
jgi:hypothetical protein